MSLAFRQANVDGVRPASENVHLAFAWLRRGCAALAVGQFEFLRVKPQTAMASNSAQTHRAASGTLHDQPNLYHVTGGARRKRRKWIFRTGIIGRNPRLDLQEMTRNSRDDSK
jgi:hypothetical protein